jgi:D-3-phosphoglycerate dehydrogenase / 2-oxoglutarate reductase
MLRVLICDKLEPVAAEVLRAEGLEVVEQTGLTGEALAEGIRGADGVIVRSTTRLSAEVLSEPGKLRAIVRAGVGVDTIDVAAASRQRILVMNTPKGNTVSAAEQAFALLMAVARRIPAGDRASRDIGFTPDPAERKKGWSQARSGLMGTQLAGKTLGVIGLGNVGRAVARRALAFDMHVVGLDPKLEPQHIASLGIEPVATLEELLPRCNFLSVHTPGGDATRGLIAAQELALLPPGACVVNTARGGVVNERDLSEALASGHLGGAALDVFSAEPLAPDNPLLMAPNLVLAPHLGASTYEAQDLVAREAGQLMADFLLRGVVQSAVNAEILGR